MNHDSIIQGAAIRAAAEICAQLLVTNMSRTPKEEVGDALAQRARDVARVAKIIVNEMEKQP